MVVSRSVGVGPMPLNSAKLPSPCRKKRSIGIMRSMALSSGGGGAMLRAVNSVPQRQQIDQELDQRAGIAADVSAVGQDLPLQLVDEPLGGAADVPLLSGHAERRSQQRDHRLQARHAVARIADRVPQMADLPGQAAQEAAIEPHVGFVEHQRRLAEPGDDAARHDFGPPGDRIVRAVAA